MMRDLLQAPEKVPLPPRRNFDPTKLCATHRRRDSGSDRTAQSVEPRRPPVHRHSNSLSKLLAQERPSPILSKYSHSNRQPIKRNVTQPIRLKSIGQSTGAKIVEIRRAYLGS